MKNLLLLFCITLLCVNINSQAQTTIGLPDTTVAEGTLTLSIPVKITNFNNVGAISIKISYDPAILIFQDKENLSVPNIAVSAVGGVLAIGWFSPDGVTSVNITDGKLLDLKFNYANGLSNLNFITDQCEISTLSGALVPTSFIDGRINSEIIPVELISFNASVNGKQVNLAWSTATETNNRGFEIERSLNSSSNFSKIAFIPGSGSTSEKQNYSYSDLPANNGMYSYRLKQIDYDGTFEYSDEINVDFSLVPAKYSLSQNYPNPFNPSTTISYSLPVQEFVSLKIFDSLGNEVSTLVNETKAAGIYTIKYNASGLSAGTYFYKIQAGSFSDTKKLTIMK